MWLLSQTEAIGDQMRAAGLELDPKTLGDLNRAPLNAIVSLGGCSAALLSGQGLIATNHHCVYGSIRYNSSPEHNYCAMARTNIIPKSHDHPKNLMVSVMVSDHHTRAFLWYIKIFAKPNPSRRGHHLSPRCEDRRKSSKPPLRRTLGAANRTRLLPADRRHHHGYPAPRFHRDRC